MLSNDLMTSYTGSAVPTIIGDVAGAATNIYGAVTGRPVTTIQSGISYTPVQSAPATNSGLVFLLVIGVIIFAVTRK